jgi:glycosyltransferase involved in cell wall biosynthesis
LPTILYVEHTGGFGGTGRSLIHLLRNLDRKRFRPTVLLGGEGPAAAALRELDVPFRIVPGLPSLTARAAANPKNWPGGVIKMMQSVSAARHIISNPADLVHVNYDGLIPLSVLLKRLGDRRPRILHVRVMNPVNAITRAYVQLTASTFRHVIFISENERDRFVAAGLDAGAVPHTVLPNPVDPALFDIKPAAAEQGAFRAVFFGTLDNLRAPDRLIEVAKILKSRNIAAQIDIFGRSPPYRKWLIFERRNDETLAKQLERTGVSDIVRLRGYTSNPEREMAASDLVIRPSRLSDPWGRDVIESMAVGVPILASGTYQGFVRHGETGILVDPWTAEAAADWIARLADDRELGRRLGVAARLRARVLFDPARYAARIEEIYDEVLRSA